jgi:hypothetical protein
MSCSLFDTEAIMKKSLAISLLSGLSLMLLLSTTGVTPLKPVLAQGHRPAFGYTFVVGNDADTSGLLCNIPTNCTLRSAIEKANANGVPDWIVFTTGTHVITLTNGVLPTLVDTTTLISGVDTSYTPEIVKINANNIAQAFKVSAYDIQLDHLRIYGAGTGSSNIWVKGASGHVVIANDAIGIDDPYVGSCNLSPNSYGGIYIDATGPLPGGDGRVYIYGDYIICHGNATSEGISLVGTNNVVIGADSAGNATYAEHNYIANNHEGIVITSGAHDNFIRNSDINNNGDINVWITGAGSDYNVLKESIIYRAGNTGVQIDGGAQYNRIGSPLGGPVISGTVIYSNTREGIYISGAATAYNLVYGNKIGVNSAGTQTLGNGQNGIVLDNGTHHNSIGGTPNERNIIGGNGWDGIEILNGSYANDIAANNIGANPGASVTLPNGYDGIYIAGGAYLNSIGDGIPNNANFIGGNHEYGIEINGSGTTSNTILANLIGGGQSGISRPNSWDGLALLNGTHGNKIGDINEGNWFDSNGASGVYIAGGAHNNTFSNNITRRNTYYGVILDGASTQLNLFQYEMIYKNGYDGIGERNSAGLNIWTQSEIYDNGGLGVDKAADFGDTVNIVNAPTAVITSTIGASGVYTVSGQGSNGTAVELYRAWPDASGFGEGKLYVGQATVIGSKWRIVDSAGLNPSGCYVVLERSILASSEFSANTCRTFLPIVLKNY